MPVTNKPKHFPEQSQRHPGKEYKMHPKPEVIRKGYKGSDKLKGKVALITGGDSGIGRAVAVHFAREGADIAINYLEEDIDARETKEMVEKEGHSCLLIKGNLNNLQTCKRIIRDTLREYGKLDILVNNAGIHYPQEDLKKVDDEQIRKTFETNIISMIRLTRLAFPHLKKGARIINTTSVTAYRGSDHLIDYAATKGAIVSFTRSLASDLVSKGILVNAVAPGPIWTPLIPSSRDQVHDFGSDTPMKRAGQPSEVAPAFVYLACDDSSYVTGQVLHVNGGDFQSS
jgi:NAD(P)-dependent dehydrogenase (short-subunit alcohol dehydrogenase family)